MGVNGREVPKILDTGPLMMEECLSPKNTLLPDTCYDGKFGHSKSNSCSVIMEILQKV